MIPTEEQDVALKSIKYWFEHETSKVYRLGGLAGTGKSSIIPMLHEYLGLSPYNLEYVAPTNKAALIVQRRLNDAGLMVNTRTLHKAYYAKNERHCDDCPLTESLRNVCHGLPGYNSCGCYLDFDVRINLDRQIKLIVCDESSMVGREIYEDLMSGIGDTKILFVGDHGQLEPVEDNYEVLKRYGKFDLMNDPDYVLTQIQRQAQDSPIIRLAHAARKGRAIPYGAFGEGIQKIKSAEELEFDFRDPGTIGITYFSNVDDTNKYHKGRISVANLNYIWRMNLGLDPKRPVVGDRVVCRDFIRNHGIAKGSLATIQEIKYVSPEIYYVTLELSDGRSYDGNIAAKQFYNNRVIWGMQHLAKWDYGYALTCHTAQGSEFDSVVVFEPPVAFIKWIGSESYSRWLYTAITRAKQHLLIVG